LGTDEAVSATRAKTSASVSTEVPMNRERRETQNGSRTEVFRRTAGRKISTEAEDMSAGGNIDRKISAENRCPGVGGSEHRKVRASAGRQRKLSSRPRAFDRKTKSGPDAIGCERKSASISGAANAGTAVCAERRASRGERERGRRKMCTDAIAVRHARVSVERHANIPRIAGRVRFERALKDARSSCRRTQIVERRSACGERERSRRKMASGTEAEQLSCTQVQACEGAIARWTSRTIGLGGIERCSSVEESAPRSCMGAVERRIPWMVGVRRARA